MKWTTDKVRVRLGLQTPEEFLAQRPQTGSEDADRRSGRTTEMLLKAAVVVLNGDYVEVHGRTFTNSRALTRDLCSFVERIMPTAVNRVCYPLELRTLPKKAALHHFYDHTHQKFDWE